MKWIIYTIFLLIGSNLFMTFAWYAHLKDFKNYPLILVILLSWGIAFLEYLFQVPANRIGCQKAAFSLFQLKIIQEVIALLVFIPFAIIYMKQPLSWNFLWASCCILLAICFIFN